MNRFQTFALLLGIGAAIPAVALAQETRESLARDIPDSRSQSYDDRRLVTPHLPGETTDREPMLDLTGNLGSPFDEIGRSRATVTRTETTTTTRTPRRTYIRSQNRVVIERRR